MGKIALMFKIENHDRVLLRKLVQDIYSGLKYHENFSKRNCDWKITYWDVIGTGCAEESRIPSIRRSILRGDIFPPIVMVDNNIIDGRHKMFAVRGTSYGKVPVAYGIDKGTGEVIFDEVYAPLVKNVKPKKIVNRRKIYCLDCKSLMHIYLTTVRCPKCGRRTHYDSVLGWTVVN